MESLPNEVAAPSGGMTRNPVSDRAWKLFKEAQDYKRPFAKDWPRFYLLYASRHWDGSQPEWMSTPVINLVFSVIQTIVPILTDSRPQITVAARQPEMEKTASVLGHLLDWLWEANDLDIKLPKVMTNAMIFGNGFLKVLWDPSARHGLGDIKVVEVDPAHIFVSPYSRTMEEADYVIHAENLPLTAVRRMFPQVGSDPQNGAEEPELTLDRSVTSQSGGFGNDFIKNTDGSAVWNVRGPGQSMGSEGNSEKLVTVLELWERREDGSLEQTVVVNDEVVEGPKPSPFNSDKMPFIHFVDHPHTWSVWAMGEVQQVDKLQIEINRRRGHIQDILSFSANPILGVDPTAVPDFDNLKARPGLVVPVEGGQGSMFWLQPPQVPAAMFEIAEMDKRDFDIILGNVDVLSGRRPAGIEAGVAIEMLHEAANVRMRLKVRHMENSLRKLGEVLIGMIQEFYTTERVFRVAGPEALMMERPILKEQFLSINKPIQARSGEDGNPVVEYDNAIPPMADAEFDVRIGPGSTLPISKVHEFQKVLTLYSMQLVDDVEVLKHSGLPRWDEVLQRSRMFWAQKVMAMNAQAGGVPQEQDGEEDISDEELQLGMAEGAVPEEAEVA